MHAIWAAISNHVATHWDVDWPKREQSVSWSAGGNKATLRVAGQIDACLELYRELCHLLRTEAAKACEQLSSSTDLEPATDIATEILRPLTDRAALALRDLQALAKKHESFNHGMEPAIIASCSGQMSAIRGSVAAQLAASISIAHDKVRKDETDKANNSRMESEKTAREIKDSRIRNWGIVLQSASIVFAALTGVIAFVANSFSWPAISGVALTIVAAIGALVMHSVHRQDMGP